MLHLEMELPLNQTLGLPGSSGLMQIMQIIKKDFNLDKNTPQHLKKGKNELKTRLLGK